MRRLKADGIVLQEKIGGDVRYSLSGEAVAFIGEQTGGGTAGSVDCRDPER